MDADSFHRVAKVLADSGEVATIEEAEAALATYGVRVVLDPSVEDSPSLQIIALTAINTASRSFLGNVRIDAPSDTVLSAPGFEGRTLSEFVAWASVSPSLRAQARTWPEIRIGTHGGAAGRAIRPWADGWSFGLGRGNAPTGTCFAPSSVAAGGLAVSEAFSLLRRDNPYAGHRSIALSLWSLGEHRADPGPTTDTVTMPSSWLVGLGHLGQAYAWTLGFMAPAEGATLVLQDIDIVTKSTLSTSVLSATADVGRKKARIVADWLEARGYFTSVVERRFDQFQQVNATEPRLALFGVDNAAARRVIEGAGFGTVIDAGLGSGFRDFRAIRVRTFPGPSKAAALWAAEDGRSNASQAPAYQALLSQGADPCGVTTLATRAVGAPFVGCVAAGYVIAELLSRQLGAKGSAVVDLNLRDPAALTAVAG
jgi:hypothetical protein